MSVERNTLPSSVGRREVLALAWPLMTAKLSFTLMSAVDVLFVGRLGTDPLAAVGLATTLVFLFQSFALGLLSGVRVNVAQRTGAGDDAAARRLGWQAIWVGAGLGVVNALLTPLGPVLLGALGASPGTVEAGRAYLQIRLLGAPVALAQFALASWFQGRGNTRTPMVATLISNALNIALDPIFIFGWWGVPRLGVGGAALATVLSFGAGTLYLALRIRRELAGVPFRPDRQLLAEVWKVGSPIGTSTLLDVMAFVVFASLLVRVGSEQMAAHVVVIRIVCISFLPGLALAEAAGVLVGQGVGAGRPHLARQAWRSATELAAGVMGAWALVFALAPRPLIALFSPGPEVAAIAPRLLLIAAGFQLFDAIATVAMVSLNGAGDTRFTMRCSVAAMWLLNLPLAWFLGLHLGWGAVGAWLGLLVEIATMSLLGVWRVRGGAWLEPAVREERRREAARAA